MTQKHKPDLSNRKRVAFAAATIASPVLFFLLLETALRVFHYGPNLSLFITHEIGERTYHIMNPEVKARYFSRFQFSPNSSQDFFLVPKPAGGFRIFCLGGSTTVGFPYGYIGSFSTFLRDRLTATFPEKNIEVINLGMTATNSFTVLDMAKELVDYEPDMLIVYDGHNEFYGALGIASNESLGSTRALTMLYLKLIHYKTFLLIRDIVGAVAGIGGDSPTADLTGTMMERLAQGREVRFGSETYSKALEVFEANLAELKSICAEHSIPLLLGSQVSNLRAQAPFISDESSLDTPEKRLAFNTAFNRGLAFWLDGKADSALVEFHRALELDSLHAGVHYHIAQALDSLGRKAEAKREYIKARDYDNLRFRTSSDFNEAIRNTADGKQAVFVDVEGTFAAHSSDSIPGSELILEHLHPNVRGYFLIAEAYAAAMRSHGLLASTAEWEKNDTVNDDALWEERTVTDFDERIGAKRIEILTSEWPFVPTPKQVRATQPGDTLGMIVGQVVAGELTWEQGQVAAAQYFERQGDFAGAERHYLALLKQIPLDTVARHLLALAYERAGRRRDAINQLQTVLKIDSTNRQARETLRLLEAHP